MYGYCTSCGRDSEIVLVANLCRDCREHLKRKEAVEALVKELRLLIKATGLENGGRGGGWDEYDPLLTKIRKLVKQLEGDDDGHGKRMDRGGRRQGKTRLGVPER